MRRIVYSVAMSLDGYIAGPNGEYDWIPMDPAIDFTAMYARYDLFVMGRKTYETMLAMGTQNPLVQKSVVVVSRTLCAEDHPGVTIAGSAAEVAPWKTLPGKDIWLFGGGVLFRALLDERLVDIVEVAVIPHLLGGGIPLVTAGRPQGLKLLGHRVYPSGIVMLTYGAA